MNEGDEQVFIRKEKEKPPSVVSHVAITDNAFAHYLAMFKRYAEGGYHDLMVLMGPNGQSGSSRIVTCAGLALNDHAQATFNNVLGAARAVLQETRKRHGVQDLALLGVGTVVGMRDDIVNILSVGGLSLYWAGGDRFYHGGLRPQRIEDPSQTRIYTVGPQNNVITIPANHIYRIPLTE